MIGGELLQRVHQNGGDVYTMIQASEWCEAVITAGKRGLLSDGAGRHGHATRWDWGVTIKSLAIAAQRYDRLCGIIAEMTPNQQVQMWSDPGMDELRRVALRERRLNTTRKEPS